MSKKFSRKGANLRAPRTAKTQKDSCNVVPWTPVFTRGRVKLVVLTEPGAKLNNSETVGSFVENALPTVLGASMKKEWKTNQRSTQDENQPSVMEQNWKTTK